MTSSGGHVTSTCLLLPLLISVVVAAAAKGIGHTLRLSDKTHNKVLKTLIACCIFSTQSY